MRLNLAVVVCGLVVLAGCGGSSNSSSTPTVKAPVANAGGPYTGTAGTAVSFSGASSSDPQGEALTYAWNFGDNGTGTGVSPTHTYAAAGTYTVTLTVTNTSNLTATATSTVIIPNGRVYGGLQPIAGAHVYLFAANTTGYGKASVPLLNSASTGASDSVGAYVSTGADGGFLWAGDYTCTPGTQVYLYALGGNSGSGTNSAAGLLAVLGNCPAAGNFSAVPYITVNEVSTIAAAYAFAGFATDATHVSSSGTALAQVGIANAFANAANLASLLNGTALATTPAGNGTVPQVEINTLANILSDCVNTSGAGSNGCQLLFTNTMSGGSTGTAPTDTATAAINIAHNPGANIATLYGLAGSTAFTPVLTAVPNDFTMELTFAGGGLNGGAGGIAVDGGGNVWIYDSASSARATKLSSSGAAISPSTGYSVGGTYAVHTYGELLAIDLSGNAWMVGSLGIIEISSSGTLLSPTNGYTGGGVSTNGIAALSIDGSGNVWITNDPGFTVSELSSSGIGISPSTPYPGGYSGVAEPYGIANDGLGNTWVASSGFTSLVKLSSSGTVLSPSGGYTGGGIVSGPRTVAIDNSGNVWVTEDNNWICKFSNAGVPLSPSTGFTGGGLASPADLAIDGGGNVWVANSAASSGVTELSNSGAVLSPSVGFAASKLFNPYGVAIDGSGNVWLTNLGGNVNELVGAAVPVVTPLALGVKNNTLGTRP